MTEEQYCHQMVDLLTRQYRKDMEPFVNRLAKIAASRPVVMYVMDPSVLNPKILTDLGIYRPDQKETPDLPDRG